MTTQRILKFHLGITFFLLSSVCRPVSALQITDLGTLGGEQSVAYAINSHDQVVGQSRTANQETHIFLYDHGQMTDISALNNIGEGTGNDINNRGQIVADIGNDHSIILRHGATTDLGVNVKALGINNPGQAVGYYTSPGGFHHAFFYNHGATTLLGPFGPEAISVATGLNDLGMIVGNATDSFMVPYRVFLYANGVMTYIIPSESYAHRINNRGQIVGEYLIANGTAFHAFIYSGGTLTDIGSDNSTDTVAYDINDNGQAVGVTFVVPDDCSRNCGIEAHAFLYADGMFTDLNTLLPSGSDWRLSAAYAINNRGHIVGVGLVNGNYHAFMLSL